MPSWVEIELDTRPPVIGFGEVQRGDALIVNYTVDEPDVTAAEFVPAGGDPLPMTIDAGRFVLDAWSPSAGVVRATVRDDVWNTALYELAIPAAGQIPGLIAGGGDVRHRQAADGGATSRIEPS